MATEYKIYLINNTLSSRTFWAFLAPPDELHGDPGVFANSSANLTIRSKQPGENSFVIPVQYVAGGGASNKAVGLNVRINSSITNNVELTDTWEVDYFTVGDNCSGKQGPDMKKLTQQAPPNMIALKADEFDQEKNENCKWYSSMSYGIETDNGFLGMTWSPDPGVTRTLTPKLTFFVSTGSFDSNKLASWSEVSNKSAELKVPSDFKNLETTVTLNSDGTWTVTPGAPQPSALSLSASTMIDNLLDSHQSLLTATTGFWNLVKSQESALSSRVESDPSSDNAQADTVKTVSWEKSIEETSVGSSNTFLTGTITVTTALTASFAIFVLAGIKFDVKTVIGGVTVKFSYNGPLAAQRIKELLVPGAQLLFGN